MLTAVFIVHDAQKKGMTYLGFKTLPTFILTVAFEIYSRGFFFFFLVVKTLAI